jgi:hypothetical protein
VRAAGERSWRLSVSDGGLLPAALWLRDALSLELARDIAVDDVPPRLLDAPPDRSDVVPVAERSVAATRWGAWWRDLVRFEASGELARTPSTPDAFLAWAGERDTERQALGAPPGFDGLADVPVLRGAAAHLYREARDHLDRHEAAGGDRQAVPPYAVRARDVAAAVAAEHAVEPGALRGAVLVLDVEGPWWRVVAPGAVACSADCLDDDDGRAEAVLRAAFVSGLDS